LLVSTVKATTLFAGGQAATAGLISVEVAALTEGVLTAMFLSKVKVAMAVLLVAVALVTGTGIMISQGSGPDAQETKSQASTPDTEKKAASPAQVPPEAGKAAATPGEIGSVYLTNAALADEKFAGKQVAVSGKMERIGAAGARFSGKKGDQPKYLYDLEMTWGGAGNPSLLQFHFTDDDRKQLAELKAGQVLTIEGKPRRAPQVPLSRLDRGFIFIIHFDDCRILKAEDWKPNP
jgi:hypothetical protein